MSNSHHSPSKQRYIIRVGICAALSWSIAMAGLFFWNIWSERRQTTEVVLYQARAFFQQIVTTRAWNAKFGGVYVPVSEEVPHNPYLIGRDRSLVLPDGREFTLVNPAYMTRQLSEIAKIRNKVNFRITSLEPLRPENRADSWEKEALAYFSPDRQEYYAFIRKAGYPVQFRYMAPLWVGESCLQCHGEQGYEVGDLRGGISVSIDAVPILETQRKMNGQMAISFFIIWLTGMVVIIMGILSLRKGDRRRLTLINDLQTAIADVKTLSGFLPICASCKNIRDDQGYWQKIEVYISEHSQAKFSHGLCLDCAKKLYPELYADFVAGEATTSAGEEGGEN